MTFAVTNGRGIYFRRQRIGSLGTSWQLSIWIVAITYVPVRLSELLRVYTDSIESGN